MRGTVRPPVFIDFGMALSGSVIGLDDSTDGGVWHVDEAGVDESECDGDSEMGEASGEG